MKKISIVFSLLLACLMSMGQERTKVVISTSKGEMIVELYDEAPLHKANFIKLAESGMLNNTLFHRVIPGFMIQGGDPDSKGAAKGAELGNGGPGYTIPAEFVEGLFHRKGALAAARMGDAVNPKKESSGSQFYIVEGQRMSPQQLESFGKRMNKRFSDEEVQVYTTEGGTPHLDGAYTVFGQLIEGMEVIERISSVKRDSRNRPVEDIQMTVTIIQ